MLSLRGGCFLSNYCTHLHSQYGRGNIAIEMKMLFFKLFYTHITTSTFINLYNMYVLFSKTLMLLLNKNHNVE